MQLPKVHTQLYAQLLWIITVDDLINSDLYLIIPLTFCTPTRTLRHVYLVYLPRLRMHGIVFYRGLVALAFLSPATVALAVDLYRASGFARALINTSGIGVDKHRRGRLLLGAAARAVGNDSIGGLSVCYGIRGTAWVCARHLD